MNRDPAYEPEGARASPRPCEGLVKDTPEGRSELSIPIHDHVLRVPEKSIEVIGRSGTPTPELLPENGILLHQVVENVSLVSVQPAREGQDQVSAWVDRV